MAVEHRWWNPVNTQYNSRVFVLFVYLSGLFFFNVAFYRTVWCWFVAMSACDIGLHITCVCLWLKHYSLMSNHVSSNALTRHVYFMSNFRGIMHVCLRTFWCVWRLSWVWNWLFSTADFVERIWGVNYNAWITFVNRQVPVKTFPPQHLANAFSTSGTDVASLKHICLMTTSGYFCVWHAWVSANTK